MKRILPLVLALCLTPQLATAQSMPYGTKATFHIHHGTLSNGALDNRSGWLYALPVKVSNAVTHRPKRVVHRPQRQHQRRRRGSAAARVLRGGYRATLSVSAYAPGCGASGAMANNEWPFVGAAAGVYAFGTRISVPGWGVVTVLDRGVPSGYLDLYMTSCYQADQWGRRTLTVTIY